jgi:tryptophan halogenase
MSAGWLWRIPTWGRWGNGYVYNNKYINAAEAQKECEKILKQKIKIAKNIKFEPGKVDKSWIGNCCAIGLSSNFVEPLEASNIGIAINQAFLLMHYLGSNNQFDRDQYNVKCNHIFDNARDFVLLHYLVNKKDSKFWRELKPVIPPLLKKQLAMWKNRLPIKEDFDHSYLLFQALNFTCVLHGIGHFNIKSIKNEYNSINQLARNLVKVELEQFKKKGEYAGIAHKEYLEYNYFSDAP